LSVALALVACGGGGGGGGDAEMMTVGVYVKGQKPGSSLALRFDNVTESVTATSYDNAFHSLSHTVSSAGSFTLSIVGYPAGQLCRLAEGEGGVLQRDHRSVQIECGHSLLNDTGIALSPDGDVGRDAETARLTKTGGGALGQDFTRLCASGDPASGSAPTYGCAATTAYPSNTWACTRDNTTGLVWLRTSTAGDAAAPAAQCGVAAWRAPSVHELLSIVHGGRAAGVAAVDADYFPDTTAGVYLASDNYLDGSGKRWALDLGNQGYAAKYSLAASTARLQWVSGSARLDNAAVTLRRSAVGSSYTLVRSEDTRLNSSHRYISRMPSSA
jgi:hypothetical protein